MAVNLSGLPKVPMRILTIVLFILTSWSCVGTNWLGLSYILSNYFVVLLGLWAERDSPAPIPVQFFFFGMVFTLLNDIISIGVMYSVADNAYPSGHMRPTFQFNAAMCIILILAKPIACLFIYREWQERVNGGGEHNESNYERLGGNTSGGSYNQGGGSYGGANSYEKQDQPPMYQPPHNQPFP